MRTLRSYLLTIAASALVGCTVQSAQAQAGQPDPMHKPYLLDTGLASHSISFENPTGAPGEGGKEASNLGVGRKGSPAKTVEPGQTVQMCDVEGPGTIRHIRVTCLHDPVALRTFVMRTY